MFRTNKEIANLIRVLCDVYEKGTTFKIQCESRNKTREFTGNLLEFSTSQLKILTTKEISIDIKSITEVQVLARDLSSKLISYLPCVANLTYRAGLDMLPDKLEGELEIYAVCEDNLIVGNREQRQPEFLNIGNITRLNIKGKDIELWNTVFKDGQTVKKEPKVLVEPEDSYWSAEDFADFSSGAEDVEEQVDSKVQISKGIEILYALNELNIGDDVTVMYHDFKIVGGCRTKSLSTMRGKLVEFDIFSLTIDYLGDYVPIPITRVDCLIKMEEGMR